MYERLPGRLCYFGNIYWASTRTCGKQVSPALGSQLRRTQLLIVSLLSTPTQWARFVNRVDTCTFFQAAVALSKSHPHHDHSFVYFSTWARRNAQHISFPCLTGRYRFAQNCRARHRHNPIARTDDTLLSLGKRYLLIRFNSSNPTQRDSRCCKGSAASY